MSSYIDAIEESGADYKIWLNLGNSLANSGEYKEAIAALDKATELEPFAAAPWLLRGECFYHLKEYEDCSRSLGEVDRAIEYGKLKKLAASDT